jgi:hypothetical protein
MTELKVKRKYIKKDKTSSEFKEKRKYTKKNKPMPDMASKVLKGIEKHAWEHSFVFRWTHIPTGLMYLGWSKTVDRYPTDENYICHGNKLSVTIRENIKDWSREILYIGPAADAYDYITKLKKSLNVRYNEMYLNHYNNTGDIKLKEKKIKEKKENGSVYKLKKNGEIDKRSSNPNPGWSKGQKLSAESRQKMSDSKRGIKRDEETKRKISETMVGGKHSEETKEIIRQSKLGKKRPQWVVDKIRKTRQLNKMNRMSASLSDIPKIEPIDDD